MKTKSYLIPIAIIILLVFIIYVKSLNNDFINWDDNNQIENPYIQNLTLENAKEIFKRENKIDKNNYYHIIFNPST